MMERAESGDVLLTTCISQVFVTTCISQVFGDVLFRIVSGDAALDEFLTETELTQMRKFRRFTKTEDFPVV